MVNPATPADLAARWRPLNTAEAAIAQTLLDDAYAILLARLPTLEARMSAVPPTVSAELVVGVICSMVLRVLRNPDGKRQESIDDYSWTRDNAVSAGLLYASEDELRLMAGSQSRVRSIRLVVHGES